MSPAGPGQRPSSHTWLSFDVPDRLLNWALLAPAVAVLAALMLYPMAYGFWLSLHRWAIVQPAQFIGWENYLNILRDTRVWNSLQVTLLFSIPAFALEVLIGFGVALLANQEIRGKGLLRTLCVVPLMVTPVVIAIHFRVMLNYDFGIVNWFFGLFGVSRIGWMFNPVLAMIALIAVEVWHQTPFTMLIFSAGLAALPNEPLEAAEADGAGWWQKLIHVIIPMMMPVFLVAALFRSYGLLRTYDLVFGLTTGGPGRATETLSYLIIDRFVLGRDIGYASAVSFLLFGISLVVSVVIIRAMGLKGQVDD